MTDPQVLADVPDERLAAAGITREQLAAALAPAPGALVYAGPAGAGQLSAPLQPDPPSPPPPVAPVPHPEQTFAPGQLAMYDYAHPADKPGTTRTQVVMVTHTGEHHVHGLVLGEVQNIASFLKGQLRGDHDPAAAG